MKPVMISAARKALRPVPVRSLIGVAVGAALLGGCGIFKGGGGPKTPVLGNRTSILAPNQSIEVDETLATVPVSIPAATVNTDWAQPGGNESKAIGHVALGANPTEVWSAQVRGGSSKVRLAAAPVIAANRLFVIDTEATVSAFDATSGARLWSTSLDAPKNSKTVFGGGASADGQFVYVSTGFGDVAALSAADGKQVWKVHPGGPLRGAPTVANGQIYVMSQDNQLFALSPTDGAIIWTESGTLQSTAVFGVAAPAAAQGTVIAGFSSGELTAYRYENGRVLWGDALSRTSISTSVATLTDIDADPVIDRGRVFAIGQGGRMASYELVSGQRLWEINIAGIATPAVVGDWVFVVTDAGRLIALARATGKVRWISALGAFRNEEKKKNPIRWSGPVLAGDHLILVSTDGDMVFVDPADGSIKSQRDLGARFTLPPVAANSMLYTLSDDGRITAYR